MDAQWRGEASGDVHQVQTPSAGLEGRRHSVGCLDIPCYSINVIPLCWLHVVRMLVATGDEDKDDGGISLKIDVVPMAW